MVMYNYNNKKIHIGMNESCDGLHPEKNTLNRKMTAIQRRMIFKSKLDQSVNDSCGIMHYFTTWT